MKLWKKRLEMCYLIVMVSTIANIIKIMRVFVLEWLGGDHSDYLGPLLSYNWSVLD